MRKTIVAISAIALLGAAGMAMASTAGTAGVGDRDQDRIQLHDGSTIVLRKVADDYDLTNRAHAFKYLRDHFDKGEICTGLLYLDESRAEMHELMGNIDTPLSELPLEGLHPGSQELKKLQSRYR